MIIIEQDALIIKISSPNQQPLALLSDLQKGIILTLKMLEPTMLDKSDFQWSINTLSSLLKNISISQDQLCNINRDLSLEQIEEFNKWAE